MLPCQIWQAPLIIHNIAPKCFNTDVILYNSSSITTEKLQGLCLLLKPDPETAASPTDATRTKRRRRWCERGQKRGKRGGIRARLRANPTSPAIPSLKLSNVRSLENKRLRLRM